VQGFPPAQLAATKGQTGLLEASYEFNAGFINYLKGHVQQVVLPQLQKCVTTTLQRMFLPDAQQQAALINKCARKLLNSQGTPKQQRDMHVVSSQQPQQHQACWRCEQFCMCCWCGVCDTIRCRLMLLHVMHRTCVCVQCLTAAAAAAAVALQETPLQLDRALLNRLENEDLDDESLVRACCCCCWHAHTYVLVRAAAAASASLAIASMFNLPASRTLSATEGLPCSLA
jgi:hypothetical protein